MEDKEFILIFNKYYPFNEYILQNPKPINDLFDEVTLISITIPKQEIKPIVSNGEFLGYTKYKTDDIYCTLSCKNVNFQLAFVDFAEHIRENIIDIIVDDFGQYEFQCLYVNDYDGILQPELNRVLEKQRKLLNL